MRWNRDAVYDSYLARTRFAAERLATLVERLEGGERDTSAMCKLEAKIVELTNEVNLAHMKAATRRQETNDEATLAADRLAALRRAS